MIVVTGAAGKTGRAILQALAARGERPVAFVRRPDQAEAAWAAGAGRVVTGEIEDAQALGRALAGARAVYHICPNMHPDEFTIGQKVIEAAAAASVQLFVYHSVLHPQTAKMPHHWQKLRVEEALFESGLDFTILQPAVYMQNILASSEAIWQHGYFPVPYAAASRLSFVDLSDVADAAARVLLEGGHGGAIYELSGTPPLTQTEVAAILSAAIGRPVGVKPVDHADWRRKAEAAGLVEYAIETLLAMFRYYEAFGLYGNTHALRWLLGREPVSLFTFARNRLSGSS